MIEALAILCAGTFFGTAIFIAFVYYFYCNSKVSDV